MSFLFMIMLSSLNHSRPRNALLLAGMDVRVSAMPAGYFIIRAPQQMDESCGAGMMQFIIGTMDLVLIWKMISLHSHDWLNTSFRHFPNWKGFILHLPGGGAIDTCSRFSPFWGTAHHGKTVYAMGYTGLGVGASRFGARVLLDILDGCKTDRTKLEMVRTKPLPFPPEPLRSIGIHLSRWSMSQADRNEGRENLWLRAMNWLGLGFDS